MQWEIVIGIETHAQLTTASKIFSGASTAFGAEPNSHTAPVDLALETSVGPRMLAFGPGYRVQPVPDFFAEVRTLLGEAAIL